MPSPVRVAAALVFRAGRLLIAQRPLDKHLGGLWEFPGGKLEDGESYPDCLARELREELGIEVDVGRMIAAVEHCYPEKLVRIQFYRCTLRSGEPQPLECADLEWVTEGDLEQFVFPPADAGLLKQLRDDPEIWDS